MAYIGNQIRQYSDRVVLDSLTASATANYTLQLNGSNYVPSSAESLTVSLNGVIQKPQDSYTVSGSTLSFASALTASDSIDFVIAERGITLQTPSAGSVNTEQLANNAVTSAKMFSGFKNGITEADIFRLTADLSSNTNPISANLERVDNASFSKIGTGMSVSSGTFSFPTTGLYKVEFTGRFVVGTTDNATGVINVTTNNSTYDPVALGGGGNETSGYANCFTCSSLVNVTDISNVKVQFEISSISSGTSLQGDTSRNQSFFTFIRLGDSQ